MFDVIRQRNICYYSDGNAKLLLDLYIPAGNEAFPLLIFFYGGGLESGSKEDISELAEEFASSGVAVAIPNYRLFPEVAYPVFIEDAARSIAWLKRNIDGYFSCKGIFVGGHSAGAYLAMMLCFDKTYLAKNGIDPDELNGYLFCSGQPTTHFNVLKYRGEDTRKVIIDNDAPICHIRSNGAPMQIICTDNDVENRLEQTQLLISTLKCFRYEKEVDFQLLHGYDHCNYMDRVDNQHSRLFQVAFCFLQRHLL